MRFILLSGFLAGSQDVRARIAASLGPFIALLEQHSADGTDDDAPARENG